jgi:hypothetical protein
MKRVRTKLDEAVEMFNEDSLAEQELAGKHNDARLDLAKQLLAIRQRVEKGEAGKTISWKKWVGEGHLNRSYQDVCKLLKIAKAPDPKKVLKGLRAQARKSMQKSRQAATPSVANVGDSSGDAAKPATESVVNDGKDRPVISLDGDDALDPIMELIEQLDPANLQRLLALLAARHHAVR